MVDGIVCVWRIKADGLRVWFLPSAPPLMGEIVINVKLRLAIGYEFEISQNFGVNTRLIQEIDLGWIQLS